MVVYSFYVFDRHGQYRLLHLTLWHYLSLIFEPAECVYKKKWALRPSSSSAKTLPSNRPVDGASQPKALSAEDDAKLIFGTVFSLRNMARKLGGPEDKYNI